MKKSATKNLFAFLLLALALWIVSPLQLIASLAELTWRAVLELALLSIVLIYVSSLKWHLFLEALSRRVPIMRLFKLYLVGYFVNLLLPSYLAGDSIRSWYVGKEVGQHEALAATILERYTGIVAMFLLAIVSMWFSPLASPDVKAVVFILTALTALVTFFALRDRSITTFSAIVGRLPRCEHLAVETEQHLRKVQAGLRFAGTRPKLLTGALILSLVFHACAARNAIVAAEAVGWHSAPFFDTMIVLPLVFIVGSIPLTPGGLGLQEGAYLYFMQGIGATPGQALAMAVLLRLKSYVLALFGGVIWYSFPQEGPVQLKRQQEQLRAG